MVKSLGDAEQKEGVMELLAGIVVWLIVAVGLPAMILGAFRSRIEGK